MTTKLRGDKGSFSRIEQVRELLEANRDLARQGSLDGPLKLFVGSHAPTSIEWAREIIQKAEKGVSLDAFCNGSQSRVRDQQRSEEARASDERPRKAHATASRQAKTKGVTNRVDASKKFDEADVPQKAISSNIHLRVPFVPGRSFPSRGRGPSPLQPRISGSSSVSHSAVLRGAGPECCPGCE